MPTTVSPRILIVDDEVEITEILADLLSEEYECLRAASAEEALAHLHGSQFQLVISDITMPGSPRPPERPRQWVPWSIQPFPSFEAHVGPGKRSAIIFSPHRFITAPL